jgi:hypothetical protein
MFRHFSCNRKWLRVVGIQRATTSQIVCGSRERIRLAATEFLHRKMTSAPHPSHDGFLDPAGYIALEWANDAGARDGLARVTISPM